MSFAELFFYNLNRYVSLILQGLSKTVKFASSYRSRQLIWEKHSVGISAVLCDS